MKPWYAESRFITVVLVLCVAALVSLTVASVALAQDQPDDEPESAIRFLLGEDETLNYDYDQNVPLRVAVVNFGEETVTVEGKLVNMGFRKDSGETEGDTEEQVEFLSESKVFTFQNVTEEIEPGRAIVLAFIPKPGVQLQAGTYSGFLVVTAEETGDIVFRPLQVTVGAEESEEPAQVEIEILDAESLSYDYSDLEAERDHIAIAVHNKGEDAAVLEWDIITDLVDEDGDPVDLNVTEEASATVESGEVIMLMPTLAFTPTENLRPGQYSGFVVLADQNGDIKHAGFTLSVPSAALAPDGEVNFEIVGVEASSPLKADYNPLFKDGESIAVVVENKGKEAIRLEGNIVFDDVANQNGQPLHLVFDLVDEPVEVEPGEIVFLNFKLVYPTQETEEAPRDGTYDGYVLITAQNNVSSKHAPVTLAVPSDDVASQTTYWGAFVEWLQGAPKWVLENLFHFHRDLEVGMPGLVIILIGLGLGIRGLALLRSRSRPGPVIVQEIEDATGEKLTETRVNKGFTALMKDWLENAGLPPGKAKPKDSVAATIGKVLAESPVEQGKWLQDVLDFLREMLFPTTGHTVTSTLWKRTGGTKKYDLTFEIAHTRTEATAKVKTVTADTPEDAVEQAASIVYHHVMMEHEHVSRRIPPWEQFSTPVSIRLCEQGKRHEYDGRYDLALVEYKQAVLEEPHNVSTRLRTIAVQEVEEPLGALAGYLKVVWQWPELLESRYRLAASLTFVDDLLKSWKDENQATYKTTVIDLLERAINDPRDRLIGRLIPADPQPDSSSSEDPASKTRRKLLECLEILKDESRKELWPQKLPEFFLKLAWCQWRYLHAQLGWWPRFVKWLATFVPFGWQPAERRYLRLWMYIWPGGRNNRGFRRMAKLADYCTLLRLLELPQPPQDLRYWLYPIGQATEAGKAGTIQEWGNDVEGLVKPVLSEFSWLLRWLGVDWEVNYTAACFYALAMTEPPSRPETRDQQSEEWKEWVKNNKDWAERAVEQLDLSVRDPDHEDLDWLFDRDRGDPDLKRLREHPEYIVWESIVGPKEVSAMSEAVQTEVNVLCYAWDVLAVGAAAEMETWKKHVGEIKLWTEVHRREVNAWCQRQHEVWRALLVWTREPDMKELYTKFCEATGTKPPEKRVLDCREDDPEELEENLAAHKKHWKFVAKRVKALTDCWDERETRTEADMYDEGEPLTRVVVSDWAEECHEAWQALAYWARHPLDSWAKEQFRKKSVCG